jgi:hypothetical protein
MAAVIAWLQVNWMQFLVILLAVDQVLIGIFPSVALFGSLKDILGKLIGSAPAAK